MTRAKRKLHIIFSALFFAFKLVRAEVSVALEKSAANANLMLFNIKQNETNAKYERKKKSHHRNYGASK